MTTELNPAENTVPGRKEILVKDIGTVVDDAGQLMKAAADATTAELSAARTKVAENLLQAKSRLVDTGSAVVNGARCTAQATDAYVKHHPWQVLGVAAAAGVLAGVLLSRR